MRKGKIRDPRSETRDQKDTRALRRNDSMTLRHKDTRKTVLLVL